MSTARSRWFRLLAAIAVFAASTTVTALAAAPSGGGAARMAPQELKGVTSSGASYRFRVRTTPAGRLCERFSTRGVGGSGSSSSCQVASDDDMHGLWEMNCRSYDFIVFGTAYEGVATVVLRSDDGRRRAARMLRRGRHAAFVLVASDRDLPGKVQARDADGTVLRTEDFPSAKELCADTGLPSPLSVSYTF